MEEFRLPGSKICVGCSGLTFRDNGDHLCPRCAFSAEDLIEQIEMDCIERDLALITEFEAYCAQRDRKRERIEAQLVNLQRTVVKVAADPVAAALTQPSAVIHPFPGVKPVRPVFRSARFTRPA